MTESALEKARREVLERCDRGDAAVYADNSPARAAIARLEAAAREAGRQEQRTVNSDMLNAARLAGRLEQAEELWAQMSDQLTLTEVQDIIIEQRGCLRKLVDSTGD